MRTDRFVIQCRVTTEDPANGFAPDTGLLRLFHTSRGPGVRTDGGLGATGATISPYFDSLLCKVTVNANSFEGCVARAKRAVGGMRIEGLKTNQPFLLRLLDHPAFARGMHTKFVDEHTEELCKEADVAADLATPVGDRRVLRFLANMVVNGADHAGVAKEWEVPFEEDVPIQATPKGAPPVGWRQVLLEKGPADFAKAVREHPKPLITCTTMRDAHQSLLMTRVRTIDLLRAAPLTSHILAKAFSLEVWGGATFDVAMRFLSESPWERLRSLRAAVPNICLQMLLRGSNCVGYTSYPDNVTKQFVDTAHEAGVDVFRIFDSLNDVSKCVPLLRLLLSRAMRPTDTH